LRPLLRSSRLVVPLYREAPPVVCQLPRLVHIETAKRGRGADYKYKSEAEREEIDEAERKAKKRRLLGMGLAGGVAAGFIYANLEFWLPGKKPAEKGTDIGEQEFILSQAPPEFPPARSIVNPDDKTGLKITLFQYQTCPFCCKARVFLDYFGFSYDVIEVNSVLRQQVKWSKYKKVPILVASYGERNLVIYVGALVMFLLGKRLKKRHDLKDDVRQSLYDECTKWTKVVDKKGGQFMGGAQPNLSDLAVFGVLNAIEGCEAFQDARASTKIGVWFDRMKAVVSTSGGKDLVAAYSS